jgi:hypothetical protein
MLRRPGVSGYHGRQIHARQIDEESIDLVQHARMADSQRPAVIKELRDWVDVVFKIAIAIAGVIAGYYFAQQKQQNDDIKLIVDMVTATDSSAKHVLGATIAETYSKKRRIPPEFYAAVANYATTSDDPKLRKTVESGTASVQQANPAVLQALRDSGKTLPVRIYFHIRDERDRDAARALQQRIESARTATGGSIIVPGIEFVPGQQAGSELRCFKTAECHALGDGLRRLFEEAGAPVKLNDVSVTYERSTSIRPNHFEAWFAGGFAQRTDSAKQTPSR